MLQRMAIKRFVKIATDAMNDAIYAGAAISL